MADRLGTGNLFRDHEIVRSMVGRVEALYAAAGALLIETMTELMTATDIGGERLVMARARLRAASAHAAETSLRIVDLAADAGSTAIFESGSLERAIRAVQAATNHVAMSPQSYAVAGRPHLGLEPRTGGFERTSKYLRNIRADFC